MVMLTLLALLGLSLFIEQFSPIQMRSARFQNAAVSLKEARESVIGDAISQSSINLAGHLRLPDVGLAIEGNASSGFTGNTQNRSVVGRYPWKTLLNQPLRDESGECLWYVVSGRFKTTPKTSIFNWDTRGQIDIIDANGSVIASNLVALLVAPGHPLEGQSRELASPNYVQCSGNYNAINYLDPFDDLNGISGETNYFAGSTNSRVALNSNNKSFVLTDTEHFNDQFLYVTEDDIFTPITMRSDFATAIKQFIDDPDFRNQVETAHSETKPISAGKGTGNLDCSEIANVSNQEFCKNWIEMVFLTSLLPPSSISIDGVPSANCSRVLIFSGRRMASQSRTSVADKANKNNYLEGVNSSSFAVPSTSVTAFGGASAFDWRTPSVDIVRCLP